MPASSKSGGKGTNEEPPLRFKEHLPSENPVPQQNKGQDTLQVSPFPSGKAKVKYTHVSADTNGHGFDIDIVNNVQGPWRVHTNVRITTQKFYILQLNETSMEYGDTYQIKTSLHTTDPASQWTTQSELFVFKEYGENCHVRQAAFIKPANTYDRCKNQLDNR